MSEIGSLSIILDFIYQLDLVTPGISPRLANSLKQILHKLKSLMYALFLPQRQHLRTTRVLNFGFFFDFTICPSVAIVVRVNPARGSPLLGHPASNGVDLKCKNEIGFLNLSS